MMAMKKILAITAVCAASITAFVTAGHASDPEVALNSKSSHAGFGPILRELHRGDRDAIAFIWRAIDIYELVVKNPSRFRPEISAHLHDWIQTTPVRIKHPMTQGEYALLTDHDATDGHILIDPSELKNLADDDLQATILHAYLEDGLDPDYQVSAQLREILKAR
jgi:hypothetical protein